MQENIDIAFNHPSAAGGPVGLDEISELPQEAVMNEHEVKGTVKEVAGKAEQTYGKAKEKVTKTVDEWASQAEDAADDLPNENSLDEALALVQENPGTAIGLSLLVGAGLGALIAYMAHD